MRWLLFAALSLLAAGTAFFTWLSVPRNGAADARGRTIARLAVLRIALVEFRDRNLRYPLESEGLTALGDEGTGVLEANPPATAYVLDGWGRPFIYRTTTDGMPLLYSVGENGIDEQGSGDDLRVSAGE